MMKHLLLVFLCFPLALVAQNTGVGTSNPLEFFSVGVILQNETNDICKAKSVNVHAGFIVNALYILPNKYSMIV